MGEHFVGKFGDGPRRALIAICTLTSIQNKPYATHMQFAYRLAKDNPEWQFVLFTPYRMSIANFRNYSVKAALETEADYIFFMDDDSVLLGNASIFKYLKDKIDNDPNKHIISPIVYVRGYPFEPMFFSEVKDEKIRIKEGKGIDFFRDFKNHPTDENKLIRVEAVGCHNTLIKTEIFKALEQPYFLTTLNNTEDIYFCMKCKEFIENIGIFVDTSITVGHLLDPLYVDDNNVESLRKMYKELQLFETIEIAQFFKQPDQIEDELKKLGEKFEK